VGESGRSFEAFFAAAYGRLVGLLFAFRHDRALAEDVVQDAFVSALLRWRVISGYQDPRRGCAASPSAGPSTATAGGRRLRGDLLAVPGRPATVYVVRDGRPEKVPFAGDCWQADW
jgi:hypothetical protein